MVAVMTNLDKAEFDALESEYGSVPERRIENEARSMELFDQL
jgi:hypothetical protein